MTDKRGRAELSPKEIQIRNTIADNLNELKTKYGLTQLELSKKAGIPQNTLSRYLNAKSTPKEIYLKKLADFFNVPISEIDPRLNTTLTTPHNDIIQAITDTVVKLDPPRQETVLSIAREELDAQTRLSDKITNIEDYRTTDDVEEEQYEYHVFEKAAAGKGFAYTEDRNYDTVYYDEDIPHDFATWISGDSMEPKYLNGEVALIKATGFDYDGAIYVIDWDGHSYIKKVYKEKDGLRLVSLNKKYADKFAAWEEEPRIIGKVIGNFMPK